MKFPDSNLWRDGLKIASYCPLCETRYNPMEAQVVGEEGDTHLLHVRCRKCANSILALVLVNHVGVSSVGLVTDLTFDDVLRLREHRRLSADDVLRTHQWLASPGWVTHLLPRVSGRRLPRRRHGQELTG